MWKKYSHIDCFEEFQDQKVAHYYFPPFGQKGLPKTQFKTSFCGNFPENLKNCFPINPYPTPISQKAARLSEQEYLQYQQPEMEKRYQQTVKKFRLDSSS